MKYIDSHAHFHSEIINNDEVIEKINSDANLLAVVMQGANINRSKEVIAESKKSDKIFCCVGIHPEDLDGFEDIWLGEIEKLTKENKVVGIGEIGLDYHVNSDNIELQKYVFERQLKLAAKLKFPVCIHLRDAVNDGYEILARNPDNFKFGVVIHCFSETAEWAQKFLDLGAVISFCGNFTFKSYNREVAKVIPLEKLMIETDSPFLSPVPFRGQINNPTRVLCVAQYLADTLDLPVDQVTQITAKNAIKFYNLPINLQ